MSVLYLIGGQHEVLGSHVGCCGFEEGGGVVVVFVAMQVAYMAPLVATLINESALIHVNFHIDELCVIP